MCGVWCVWRWVLVSRCQSGVSCVGVGFKVWFGPPFPWTALPLDRPKFRSFLPSLGVFSLNFGGVFEDWGPQMCTFGLLGCRVKPRRPHQTGPPGLAHDQPENSKRAHLNAPALQTPPKFHEKTPREGRKERILRREREKKARNFGPHRSGSHYSGLHPSGPHPSGLHPSGPHWVWPLAGMKKINN